MNNVRYIWALIKIEHLPQVLLGDTKFVSRLSKHFDEYSLDERQVYVGYIEEREKGIHGAPAVVVVSDSHYSEVFAWILIYAQNVSPVSLFSRVVTASDFRIFTECEKDQDFAEFKVSSDLLACLILGEILSQGEIGSGLHMIAMSRAAGCLLTPVCRSIILYKNRRLVDNLIHKLHKIEVDSHFSIRTIKTKDIALIIEVFMACHEMVSNMDLIDVVHEVMRIAFKISGVSYGLILFASEFKSDFIEERVVAFRNLVARALIDRAHGGDELMLSIEVAFSAFLVGRGTSHLFLLKELEPEFPLIYLWFGLLASVSGRGKWDVDWLKSVKVIEKYIKSSFSYRDSMGADVCWAEYDWASNVMKAKSLFVGVPKSSPKALSIEIFPGINCQFRMLSDNLVADKFDIYQRLNEELYDDVRHILLDVLNASRKAEFVLNKLDIKGVEKKYDKRYRKQGFSKKPKDS